MIVATIEIEIEIVAQEGTSGLLIIIVKIIPKPRFSFLMEGVAFFMHFN